MKTTRILAISVLVLVVGLPAGVAKAVGDARPTVSIDDGAEWLDVRYDDAYFVIDCYMDSNGDTWLLCWDYVLDDVVCLEIVQRRGDAILDDVFCRATGNKEISIGGGGGGPTESISVSQPGGGSTGPTRAK